MWLALVVEIEVAGQGLSGNRNGVVAMQVNFLILDALPQPFDEDVIAPAALAIHADLDAMLFEEADESGTGELAALVRIHNLRRTVFQDRFFQRIDTGIGCQAERQTSPLIRPVSGRP